MASKSKRQAKQQAEPRAVALARIEEARNKQATTLDLSRLGLTELPKAIGSLTQLQTLSLSGNQLTSLPEAIGSLTRLQMLYLSDNQLTSLPEAIGSLTQLQELYLSGNQLTSLPEAINSLTQLQVLNLTNNPLTSLPEAISSLTQLQTLNLGHFQHTSLLEAIGSLTRLQTLILSDNQLTSLPDVLSSLTQLRHLYLYNNQLTSLPEAIGSLTQLQTLSLLNNQFTSLPNVVNSLTQLRHLYLTNNQLTSLPEATGSLTQLQTLNLSGNQFTSLPEAIGSLTQLRELILSDNQLTSLPEAIGSLTQLQELYLSGNQLTSLPEAIGSLTQLQVLSLSGNQLTSLPEALEQLASLERLFLHDNPQLGLPAEVLGPKSPEGVRSAEVALPSSILDYYFRARRGSRPLNEAKLILVGRGGVGKTSLVKRLLNKGFKPGEQKTEGIQITEWPIRINRNEQVQLNIWDFGGQEIMHATHQFFLTQRSLYLLVLNGREGGEDTDADYWLRLIESFGGESPVIVVLNKIKEHPFNLNRRALQQKYSGIRAFIETDCKDKTGITALRTAIKRETDNLDNLRDPFPASWWMIKAQLSKMQENYLGFETYRAFCKEHGEKDKGAQEKLAGYLHQLGVVLNYKDDPRLRDTHVLNPHWVTTGIYKILNSDKLTRQQGEIRLDDIGEILDPDEYPPHMGRFIFDLMKKFDLCFTFPNDECHYLIPELLDKQEPEETAEFTPDACLNFQYQYPILPEGLLPRFIVRTHHLSEGLPRWRTGVILKFEGNRALVKADVADKNVFISVAGSREGRRRLLTLIRIEFDSIHRGIRNLQPQEIVPLPEHPSVVVPYRHLLVIEEKGARTFPMVVDDDLIEVDVQALLNGVDLERTRRRERAMEGDAQAVRIFYSYAHKDESLRNELETHLKLLHRQKLIEPWHDRQIDAGDDWKAQIDDNLERADIILLLISADFIASEYCYEKEMQRALERHNEGTARVIPIIIRKTNWRIAPFQQLQALPKDALPVTLWPDRDSAWTDVSEGIQRVVEEMQKGR